MLKLAEKAGLAKLGHVALDGTKIKANASRHKVWFGKPAIASNTSMAGLLGPSFKPRRTARGFALRHRGDEGHCRRSPGDQADAHGTGIGEIDDHNSPPARGPNGERHTRRQAGQISLTRAGPRVSSNFRGATRPDFAGIMSPEGILPICP